MRDAAVAHPTSHRAPFLVLCRLIALLVVFDAAVSHAAAQGAGPQVRGIVDRFPTPQQVLKDFGDDPSRRVALQVLYFALQQKTPVPRSQAASDRITAYFRAFGEVDHRYDRLGAQSAAYKSYYARVRQLLNDPAFANTVVNKYRLAGLPPERPLGGPIRVGPTNVGRARQDLTDQIKAAVPQALPYWLGALLLVALLPAAFWRLFDEGSPASALRAGSRDDAFQLPESMRVLNILGKRLALHMESGIVIQTDTAGGYDRIWIRDLSGHESTAGFASGIFPARQGHLVTFAGDGRRLQDGNPDYFFGYNHAMKKFVPFGALENALQPRKSRLPWLASTVFGAVGFWLGLAALVRQAGPVVHDSVEWSPVVLLGVGIVAVIAWISARLTAGILFRKRLKRFSGLGNMFLLLAFFHELAPKMTEILGPTDAHPS